MNKTDMEFFETYKRLDRLCSDVFGLRNGGVTRYIDELKAIGYEYSEDCKTLKRLRHIRNQMAHDEGTFDYQMCDREDIIWLNTFYNRMMKGDDPLAVHYRAGRKAQNTVRNNVQHNSNISYSNTSYRSGSNSSRHRKSRKANVIFNIIFFLLIIACACYIYFFEFN